MGWERWWDFWTLLASSRTLGGDDRFVDYTLKHLVEVEAFGSRVPVVIADDLEIYLSLLYSRRAYVRHWNDGQKIHHKFV